MPRYCDISQTAVALLSIKSRVNAQSSHSRCSHHRTPNPAARGSSCSFEQPVSSPSIGATLRRPSHGMLGRVGKLPLQQPRATSPWRDGVSWHHGQVQAPRRSLLPRSHRTTRSAWAARFLCVYPSISCKSINDAAGNTSLPLPSPNATLPSPHVIPTLTLTIIIIILLILIPISFLGPLCIVDRTSHHQPIFLRIP